MNTGSSAARSRRLNVAAGAGESRMLTMRLDNADLAAGRATLSNAPAMRLCGIDHVDVRVSSLAEVEAFYDKLLPALGLPRKTESHVGLDGEWYDVDASHARNVVEYSTPSDLGARGWFIGFVEDAGTTMNKTRIAFALDFEADLAKVETLVRAAGGRVVEWSSEEKYPALFFEDPAGTRLEICARRPPRPTA